MRVTAAEAAELRLGAAELRELNRIGVSEERLEQVREIDGEQAYEKMRRAVEKASQEKARQERARQSRERRGPERGGPKRDFGPSR